MQLYITSVGERTTEIAKWQAERLGFEVIVLDEVKPWVEKYKEFIKLADKSCIRCDADIILNKNILEVNKCLEDIIQYRTYDFYKNNVGITCPVYYTERVLKFLKENIDHANKERPETWAWRLAERNGYLVYSDPTIVGIHGCYSDRATIDRAKLNKANRGQMNDYDFDLTYKLLGLYE